MSLYKRKNPIDVLANKAGDPTKADIHSKAKQKLKEAKKLAKDKPVRFAKQGENDFSRSLQDKGKTKHNKKMQGPELFETLDDI